MNDQMHAAAIACARGSEDNSLNFPQQLSILAEAGLEAYVVDYRRSTKTYYAPDGDSVEIEAARTEIPVGAGFDAAKVAAAVGQSQRGEHTYKQFCEKVMAAGCAGYIVSILGRRVVYFGRTAETHVEHFPPAP